MKNYNLVEKREKIEEGIIKVAWIEEQDNILFSKMFDSLAEAKKFTKKKEHSLIFKLLRRKDLEFKWELIDYGKAKDFFALVKIYREYGLEKGFGFFQKLKKRLF